MLFPAAFIHVSQRAAVMSTNFEADLSIRLADLSDEQDQQDLLYLLNHYAEHPIIGGKPLPQDVLRQVIPGLTAHPSTLVFLATIGDSGAVGMATCLVGFSTFQAQRLINIHDLMVHSDYQRRGIGAQLIDAVAKYAKENDCCALTLEVRADNPARWLYEKKGFQSLSEPIRGDTMLFGKLPIT